MPHARATTMFARTVYRELKRADYDNASLLRFVGELMEIISSDAAKQSADKDSVAGVVDPETGLPDHTVFGEVLDFEIQRAARGPQSNLLLVAIDVTVPPWCHDDVDLEVHLHVASVIRRSLRHQDTLFRWSPQRYLLILPNATLDVAPVLYARLTAALGYRRRTDEESPLPERTTFSARCAAWTSQHVTSESFVAACLAANPVELALAPPSETPPGERKAPARPDSGPRRVVLALGGGAGRAAAHVGAMRVLVEAGVEIEGIAGTSAGALVGAMWLSGQSFDEILERLASFVNTPLYQQMRRLSAEFLRRARQARPASGYFRKSGLAFLSGKDLAAIPDELYQQFIEHLVGRDRDIASLSKPFAASATDLIEGRTVLFTRGPLHAALRASCAVPGLFYPQREGSRLCSDGAIVSDVPIHAAEQLGTGAAVLGVHLARPKPRVNAFNTAAEVQVRAHALVHGELVREQLRQAPLLLIAEVGEVGWLDFRHARKTAAIGESAARAALPRLLLNERLLPEPAP
jgi:NTE family protein